MAAPAPPLAGLLHRVSGLRAAMLLEADGAAAVGEAAAELARLAAGARRLLRALPRDARLELGLEGGTGSLALVPVPGGTLCLLLARGASLGRASWEARRALRERA